MHDLVEGELTAEIIAAFYTVYNALRFGLLERIYANALAIELRARGFRVEREVPVEVLYLGVQAGFFRLDLVVEDKVLVRAQARFVRLSARKARVVLEHVRVRSSGTPAAATTQAAPIWKIARLKPRSTLR